VTRKVPYRTSVNRSSEQNRGAREVKTKRLCDEAAPEQGSSGDGTNVRLHTHKREEKKLETMTLRALEKELKYIQDS